MTAQLWKILKWFRSYTSSIHKRNYHRVGEITIKLTPGHNLPNYQLRHHMYDRFLPVFVAQLGEDGLVVDVGANVGDTLAGLVSENPNLRYLCIEEDPSFFGLLQDNVKTITRQVPNANILCLNLFVGLEVTDVSLDGSGGSKRAISGGDIRSVPLGEVVRSLYADKRVLLIKSDVDGYDFDVLRSAYSLMSELPFLYFECQIDKTEQHQSFSKLFFELLEMGYNRYEFFDNYGQHVITLRELGQLLMMLNYTRRQNDEGGTRTIIYYDVLAYSDEASPVVEQALQKYETLRRR